MPDIFNQRETSWKMCKQTKIKSLQDQTSLVFCVNVYCSSPQVPVLPSCPLSQTSTHFHTWGLLVFCWFWTARTGTDWLRSLVAGFSSCRPPLFSPCSPVYTSCHSSHASITRPVLTQARDILDVCFPLWLQGKESNPVCILHTISMLWAKSASWG